MHAEDDDRDERATRVELAAVRAAFDASPRPTFVVRGDDHEVVAVNGALSGLLGGVVELGEPAAEVLPIGAREPLVEVLDRVRRVGTGVTVPAWVAVGTTPSGDGTIPGRLLELHLLPWRGEDGTVQGVVGSAITVDTDEGTADDVGDSTDEESLELQDLTLTLQDALMPSGIPVLRGLSVSGCYLYARDSTGAGGDWLDVVAVPNGKVALVVGDVVGGGFEAFAAMGQLRAVSYERLSDGADLGEVLASLERIARSLPAAHAATVAIVCVDPESGELAYVTAGHPPPLFVSEAGYRFLPPSGGVPLGTGGTFRLGEDRLDPDEMVLLYTDGIIERPGLPSSRATLELARVAGKAFQDRITTGRYATPAERVCRQTVSVLTGDSGHDDDVVMLAAQRVPAAAPLRVLAEAKPAALADVRRQLGEWLSGLRTSPLDTLSLQHAVGEVVSNVVEHAYEDQDGPRPLTLTGDLRPEGRLELVVEDRGTWRRPGTGGGRGLAMVDDLVDELVIEQGGDPDDPVTRVWLRHHPVQPVTLLQAGNRWGRPPMPEGWRDYEAERDGAVLRVVGVIDLVTSEQLREDVMGHIGDATGPLVLDLSEVELLASAGVQVLFDARDVAVRHGIELSFRAERGSVAHHVLQIVGLEVERTLGGPDTDMLPPL